jgi:predicted N-acetyltransferase YhbS
MSLQTIVSQNEEVEFTQLLKSKIREFNNTNSSPHKSVREPDSVTPLNLILKDEAGNVIGGLAASTYWGWLDIDDFFIPTELRGKGTGTELLKTAESIAIQRGCHSAFLSTFEFQAHTFYERHGYYVTGKLEGYPPGSTYYWMRKDF